MRRGNCGMLHLIAICIKGIVHQFNIGWEEAIVVCFIWLQSVLSSSSKNCAEQCQLPKTLWFVRIFWSTFLFRIYSLHAKNSTSNLSWLCLSRLELDLSDSSDFFAECFSSLADTHVTALRWRELSWATWNSEGQGWIISNTLTTTKVTTTNSTRIKTWIHWTSGRGRFKFKRQDSSDLDLDQIITVQPVQPRLLLPDAPSGRVVSTVSPTRSKNRARCNTWGSTL